MLDTRYSILVENREIEIAFSLPRGERMRCGVFLILN
jgi:hypothetical protein